MNIFQVYKIIMGLVIAGFVIAFFATFMGDYAGLNTQTMTYKAMNNFRNSVHDVYITGNTVDFLELSQNGIDDCTVIPKEENEPTEIRCGSIGKSFFTPIMFTKEKEGGLFLERSYLDLGWTKFYMVSAISDMTVIFIPETIPAIVMMENITSSFSCDLGIRGMKCSYQTGQQNENLRFTTCTSSFIQKTRGKTEFLSTYEILTGECTSPKPSYNHRFVNIRANCAGESDEICIETTATNTGNIYVNGNRHVYEDMFDILSIIIGGAEKDIFGNSLGERLFEEKNKFLENQLAVQRVLDGL